MARSRKPARVWTRRHSAGWTIEEECFTEAVQIAGDRVFRWNSHATTRFGCRNWDDTMRTVTVIVMALLLGIMLVAAIALAM